MRRPATYLVETRTRVTSPSNTRAAHGNTLRSSITNTSRDHFSLILAAVSVWGRGGEGVNHLVYLSSVSLQPMVHLWAAYDWNSWSRSKFPLTLPSVSELQQEPTLSGRYRYWATLQIWELLCRPLISTLKLTVCSLTSSSNTESRILHIADICTSILGTDVCIHIMLCVYSLQV